MRWSVRAVSFLLAVLISFVSSAREFTDSTGAHRIDAEIVSADATAQTVTLRRSDGKQFTSPIKRFSAADQAFIAQFLAKAAPKVELTKTERAKQATAFIVGDFGSGSAFCIREDGVWVTNRHVVEMQSKGLKLVYQPSSEKQEVLPAKVVSLSETSDLAILKVESKHPFVTLQMGEDKNAAETAEVTTVGYPFGQMLSFSGKEKEDYPEASINLGRIRALRKADGKLKFIQIDAVVNPGNSGGPLLDKEGAAIGVVTAGIPGAQVNLATPIGAVRELLAKPGLVIDNSSSRYADLCSGGKLRLSLFEWTPAAAPIEWEVNVTGALAGKLVSPVKEADGSYAFALPKAEGISKLKLYLIHGDKRQWCDANAGPVTVGQKTIPLEQIESIERSDLGVIVRTTSGDRLATPSLTLDARVPQAEFHDALGEATWIRVVPATTLARTFAYTLVARRDKQDIAKATGSIEVVDVPDSLPAGPALDRLVHYWRFDEEGGNAVRDAVGRSNGYTHCLTWTDGMFGKAIYFQDEESSLPRAGHFVDLPAIELEDNLTFAFWFKAEGARGDAVPITSQENSGSPGFAIRFFGRDGNPGAIALRSEFGSGEAVENFNPNFGHSLHKWQHFAVSLDRGALTGKIYYEGNLIATLPLIKNYSTRGMWRLGSEGNGNQPYFGAIDDLRIYDGVLSADEVKALYEVRK